MITAPQMLASALISLALSLAVLRLLSSPLRRVLQILCPEEAAAAFWVSYAQVMLTLAPLLATQAVLGLIRSGHPATVLRWALMAALAGLLFGLHLVGRRLAAHTRQPERCIANAEVRT